MRTAAQRLGDAAERLAAEHLVGRGWSIVARNVRVGRHEIDLIAVDPGPPSMLVFVEVRWRASREFGLAEETVDVRKRSHLRAAAFGLLDGRVPNSGAIRPLPRLAVRFDLIAVEPGRRIRHHPAFG